MKELSEKEILNKAARYCSVAEHCISEVTDKLKNWGADTDITGRIIDYLIKEKYIDEERYCRSFIKEKFRYNKWGRLKIANALWQKSVSSEAIRLGMEEIEEEEYSDILKRILVTRKSSIKAKDKYELKIKLMRFGISRGFENELVKQIIDHILK